MKKGRILHISKYYSPYSGGLEDVCRSLVDGVPEYERRVLCFNDGPDDATDTVGQTQVTRVGLWKEVARQPISFHFIKTMRRMFREYQPDIVHLHTPNPLISLYIQLFKPRKAKLIVHWHSDIIVHRFLHLLFSPIEKRLLRKADHILATSPNYIDGSPLLSRHREKCTVIPNMVAEPKLAAQPASGLTVADVQAKYGPNIVLFVGRHVGYKGIGYLIEAAQYVESNFSLLICGTGPETEKLKAQAGQNPNIIFLGRIPDDELGTYMRASKVFAFPSITKNEAFGVVLAEAMYCGLVPVTFTIYGSGVNWVSVGGETGIEVPNRDTKAFARAIDTLLTDETLRLRYSEAAQRRVREKFLFSHVHDSLLQVYDKVMQQ